MRISGRGSCRQSECRPDPGPAEFLPNPTATIGIGNRRLPVVVSRVVIEGGPARSHAFRNDDFAVPGAYRHALPPTTIGRVQAVGCDLMSMADSQSAAPTGTGAAMERTASGPLVAGLRRLWVASALLVLSACSGGGEDGNGTAVSSSTPSFEVGTTSAIVPVMRGSGVLLAVRVERQPGFSESVRIELSPQSSGIVAPAALIDASVSEGRLRMSIGTDVPLGPTTVTLRGTAGAATSTIDLRLDVQAERPNAQETIQAALVSGQIDLGTSLLYRAYAMFGSSKLPEAFVGSGPGEDLALIGDIERERPNLPGSVLEKLKPFVVRPADPDSVFNAGQPASQQRPKAPALDAGRCAGVSGEWITSRSATHPVRAWALCTGIPSFDTAAERDLAKIIGTVDKVYGLMTGDMGPAVPDLWGDEAIDVFVVPEFADPPRSAGDYAVESVRGVAIPQPPSVGSSRSGYIMLPRYVLTYSDFPLTLIHELFHVLQFAHNGKFFSHWFTEASASWAGFHYNRRGAVDPETSETRHREWFGLFQATANGLRSVAGDEEYGAYAWPLFMEQEMAPGRGTMIADAWRKLPDVTTVDGATDAVDGILPFATHFRAFALRNLNREFGVDHPLPPERRYVSLEPTFPDSTLTPREGIKRKMHRITGIAKQTLSLGRPVQPLSAVYLNATVADPTLKKVVFDLSGLTGTGIDVDALVRIGDRWEREARNLNGKKELTFCLDDPKEALQAIEFVVSNHQKREGSQVVVQVGVTGDTKPCNTVWTGSSFISVTAPGIEKTASADVVLEFDDSVPAVPYQPFRLRRGAWRFEQRSFASPTCELVANAGGDMVRQSSGPLASGATQIMFELFTSLSPASYRADGSTVIEYREKDCQGREIAYQGVMQWLLVPGPGSYSISDDGNVIEGQADQGTADGRIRTHWKFVRSRD